jgi:hypothetical protein
MTRYAARTEVTSDRSRTEIERTLSRYGATAFMYGWQGGQAVIAFEAHGRQIRFHLPMPDRQSGEFTRTQTGRPRSTSAAASEYDQAVRQRWRALTLVVKAKLEAVAAGIVSFEDEFLAHTVITGGATVADWLQPQLEQAYSTGEMPGLLPQPQYAIEAEIVS